MSTPKVLIGDRQFPSVADAVNAAGLGDVIIIVSMPDREMDVLVAEKVMGWKVHPRNTAHWMRATDDECDYRPVAWVGDWSPSRFIAAALEAVETVNLRMELVRALRREFGCAKVTVRWECTLRNEHGDPVGFGGAASGSLAICFALLEAKGVEVPNG